MTLGCGEVVLPGYEWLDGEGVDVFSNGADGGSGDSCGGTSYVGKVVSGEQWQCVELIDRLYLTRGWISETWFGNGADMYSLAPGNLARQPQGSISFLSPGDVISYESPGGVEPGHAGIVNTVTPIGLGRFEVQLVQQNGFLYTSGILSNGILTMTTAWVRNFPVIGVIHHPGATAQVSPPANLLRNASFENDATAGWTAQNPRGGKTWAAAEYAADLPEGGNLLDVSTTKPNGSVYQDVPADLVPDESYTFSVWVEAGSAVKVNICVVLWGVGETTEHGQTCAWVGQSWTLLSAPYDVRANGLDKLRAQVYLHTPRRHLDLTGASLVNDALANASFESDLTAGWKTKNPHGGAVRAFAHRAPRLPGGANLLELSTSRANGAVYQDVPVDLAPGQSYTFSVWVRASAPTKETVCVVLWGRGGGQTSARGQTCARVGTTWTQMSAPYDVNTTGLTMLRAEVYLRTAHLGLDLTGASLVDDGLASASFENDVTTGWHTLGAGGGAVQAFARKATGLPEGGNLLKLGTARPGGSIYQDVAENLLPSQSYTFSVWLRSNAATEEGVCVTLWGIGGGAQGQTCLDVGPTWTLVAVPYAVSAAGLTELRAQVYLLTAGPRLDLTGASLGRAA